MKYIISCPKPQTHYLDIEYIIENDKRETVTIQLPAWRPGRYELGNFAKNIQKWQAYDSEGIPLPFYKISKDCWKVEQCADTPTLHIKYNYFADKLDAGSCRADEQQIYINPVHCCLYDTEKTSECCEVELHLPASYKVATALKQILLHQEQDKKTVALFARNYDEFVDSPLIASASLQHDSFFVKNVKFNLWFNGECRPDMEKIKMDFKKFIDEQTGMIGEFPAAEYHFLFQLLPVKFYHGVEHGNSTVIALGPGYNLMKDVLYEDFLGISSHELFHAWNIKKIRPVEMFPYNYTRENYSRLGYVAEGITTYYGDLTLFRAAVFNDYGYFKTIHKQLQKHFDNYGRFNLSVADSSFDTWLDGYTDGIPDRKVSIYTEGCLCALAVDLLLRKYTGNKKSLDDVLRTLYYDFAKKEKGYSAEDYKQIIEAVSGGISFDEFFRNYYNGTKNYEPLLEEVFDYVGCEILKTRSRMYFENRFGFKVGYVNNGFAKITAVAPCSIAEKAGLSLHDEIIAINDIKLQGNLKEWCKYFAEEPVKLSIVSNEKMFQTELYPSEERYFWIYYTNKKQNVTEQQKKNYEQWTKRRF